MFKLATVMLLAFSSLANCEEETDLHKEEHMGTYILVRATYVKLTPAVPHMLSHNSTFFGLYIPYLPKYAATPLSHHRSTPFHEHLCLNNYDTQSIKC